MTIEQGSLQAYEEKKKKKEGIVNQLPKLRVDSTIGGINPNNRSEQGRERGGQRGRGRGHG